MHLISNFTGLSSYRYMYRYKSFTVLSIRFLLYVARHTTTRRGPDVARRPDFVHNC